MTLSHSPTLTSDTTSIPILPQYLQAEPGFFKDVTAQLLFRCFRNVGPLVSVRMNVDIGDQRRTAVVEYWKEEHANSARLLKNAMHKSLKTRPAFSLRTYDPYRLRCSVRHSPSESVHAGVDNHLYYRDLSNFFHRRSWSTRFRK